MKSTAFRTILLASLAAVPVVQAGPVAAGAGDLLLGFRAPSGTGAEFNLMVNLGPASHFSEAAAGATEVLSTKLSVEDLKAVYGDDWATRPELTWGIVGTTGTTAVGSYPARTIWASAPEDTAGTASSPWARASTSGLQNASGTIFTMYAGSLGSFTGAPATANSAFAAKINPALDGSWTKQEDVTANQSFRRFTPTVRKAANAFPAAGSAYDGTGYAVLDLWEIRPVTGAEPATIPTKLAGAFGLNSAGKLVFSKDITRFAPAPAALGEPTITLNAAGTVATIILANAPAGTYVLERSLQLTTGTWSSILIPQSPVSGVVTFVDPAAPAPRSFYRIKKTS